MVGDDRSEEIPRLYRAGIWLIAHGMDTLGRYLMAISVALLLAPLPPDKREALLQQVTTKTVADIEKRKAE